jgi:putative restriction endonuclease
MDVSIMIDRYLKGFAGLHSNKNRFRWTAATTFRAPHKPLLLLSVIDLISQGRIKTNFIELDSDLCDTFNIYWSCVMPPGARSNIALPFFHLKHDEFWKLVPKPGMENILKSSRQVKGVSHLKDMVMGAKIDDELYNLIIIEESRKRLQSVLIGNYFAPQMQAGLFEQSRINKEAFRYSEALLEKSIKQQVGEGEAPNEYTPAARDQGFRRAVVSAYDHRCAVCGIRMLTSDMHTAVDAAHIMPWSKTQNDSIQNGMALCRLCHWTFDEGPIGVNTVYTVIISRQLLSGQNIPSHVMTFEGRVIIGPAEKILWPDHNNLNWHRIHVFREL